jgi:hypothetical protein
MKHACLIYLFLCLTAPTIVFVQSNPASGNRSASVPFPSGVSQADPVSRARILDIYGKLPLSFEANQGQTDGRVKFLSRTSSYSLFLTGDEAVLALRAKSPGTDRANIAGDASQAVSADPKSGGVLRMKLRNANAAAKVTGMDELTGASNYFIGNDSAKWRTNVPTYAKVKYEGIYSGVDLVYYGSQRQLEYDFIVAPGADPRRVAFDISGAKRIRRDERGDLVFKTGEGEIRWNKPVAYQEKDGARQLVAAQYAITDTNRVGFEVAKYDASRPLYIDPLIYSSYLGGSTYDAGYGLAVDSAGNVYVTGQTKSPDFPTTAGAFQTSCCGAFVAKINPAGSELLYSTYLGANDETGSANAIAVDSAGNAYVTGVSFSADFPITPGALQTTGCNVATSASCSEGFVSKLDPLGSKLIYSTYLGGSATSYGSINYSNGIAVDSRGNAYVTGYTESPAFPTTPGAFQTTCYNNGPNYCNESAFVTKINSAGSALVYSTFLGGSDGSVGFGITVDSSGDAYVTGGAGASLPVTPSAFQTTYGGGWDAFVSKINPAGTALVYSTYLGGSGFDQANAIAVDRAGNAYITGFTGSTNLPTKVPLQPSLNKSSGCVGGAVPPQCGSAFVSKIGPGGSALVYSTYLSGPRGSGGLGIAADSAGSAYVTGFANYSGFPLKNPLQQWGGGQDVFVTKINSAGTAFVYSTYLGGSGHNTGNSIVVDSRGNTYVTGWTSGYTGGMTGTNNPFPTTSSVFEPSCANNPSAVYCSTAFVSKFNIAAATTTTLSSSSNPSAYGQAVTFSAVILSALGAPPNGEIVKFMNGTKILGTGTLSSGSARFTTSTLPAGTDNIKAVYGGDSNFFGSTSKAVSQVVGKATTTTTLISSLNPSNVGQAVTFTASVTPEFNGKVTGTVTFYDGATLLKTVSVTSGMAKFTTTTLASGAHTIKSTYNGSASFDGSSSASLTQTVK